MTTTPIRATYAPLPPRRRFRRRLTMALTLPPLAAASLGLTTAMIAGTYQGMTAPAAHAPAPTAPAHITLASATTRPRPALNPFPLLLSKLPACHEEDGSGSRLPCAWVGSRDGNHRGLDYIIIRDGHRNRKTHIQKVIYIYRDHTEKGTI